MNVKRVKRTSKLYLKLGSLRKVVYQNNYTKKSIDQNGSLSYKSRDKNKSEKSLGGFKLIHNL